MAFSVLRVLSGLTSGRMTSKTRRVAAVSRRSRGRPRKRETHLSRWIDTSGVSRDDVARQLEINRTHLDKICRGSRRPGLALALAIEKLTAGEIPAAEWLQVRVHRDI